MYAHPFAEELNKTRRMASLGARALAGEGWAVLLMDLAGCGDSDGDFGDASWNGWQDDLRAGARWLASNIGGVGWLWGTRAGALLAAVLARQLDPFPHLLLWQPVVSGKQHLAQFLRMRLARDSIGSKAESRGTEAMRAELIAGKPLEIAGYPLAPAVALGLDAAQLELAGYTGDVKWFEVGSGDPPELAPGSRASIARWKEGGAKVDALAVAGPGFWQTVEITECPALVEATVRALQA